jgi:hypothetical protein
VNIGKTKDETPVATAFHNFFLTTANKLNTHKFEKEDAVSFLKD